MHNPPPPPPLPLQPFQTPAAPPPPPHPLFFCPHIYLSCVMFLVTNAHCKLVQGLRQTSIIRRPGGWRSAGPPCLPMVSFGWGPAEWHWALLPLLTPLTSGSMWMQSSMLPRHPWKSESPSPNIGGLCTCRSSIHVYFLVLLCCHWESQLWSPKACCPWKVHVICI